MNYVIYGHIRIHMCTNMWNLSFFYNNTVQINFVMGTFLFYGRYHCCNRKHREYVIEEKEKQKAEICFYSWNEIDHLYRCSFNLYEEKILFYYADLMSLAHRFKHVVNKNPKFFQV